MGILAHCKAVNGKYHAEIEIDDYFFIILRKKERLCLLERSLKMKKIRFCCFWMHQQPKAKYWQNCGKLGQSSLCEMRYFLIGMSFSMIKLLCLCVLLSFLMFMMKLVSHLVALSSCELCEIVQIKQVFTQK